MSELLVTGARDPASGKQVSLLVRDGAVAAAETASVGARRVAADGLWLAPGFIDLQLNGAFGHDFTADPTAPWLVGERLTALGVTAFLPTAVSAAPDSYDAIFDSWAGAVATPGAQPLGWHLEGPMLAPSRAGAHDPAQLRSPARVDLSRWRIENGLRMVTIAPELPGAMEAIRQLTAGGIVVSAGHTDAEAACAPLAIRAGVRYATHLLNAMRGLDRREPGIGLGLLLEEVVTVGIIADGQHLADTSIELIWRIAGPERISVVSDGISALGEPAGAYRLGRMEVRVGSDAAARLADGRLAGAVASLPVALRTLRRATGCTMSQALGTVTRVPARLLGLRDRGHLAPGARGDAVLLDDGFQVRATIVAGEPVHYDAVLGWA